MHQYKAVSYTHLDVYKRQLVYLTDSEASFQLELTWLKDHPQAYELGENESHICFVVDDYEAYHQLHQDMGCICFENEAMGLYFIHDPDDYWLETVSYTHLVQKQDMWKVNSLQCIVIEWMEKILL